MNQNSFHSLKPFLLAEIPLAVGAGRIAWFPGQFYDRHALLGTIGKGLEHEARVTFLNDLDFDGLLWQRTLP